MSVMHDAPPAQTCPTCGLAAAHEVSVKDGAVVTLTAVCPLEHLWIVKWTERG